MVDVLGFWGAYPWLIGPAVCSLAMFVAFFVIMAAFDREGHRMMACCLFFLLAGFSLLFVWLPFETRHDKKQQHIQEAACRQVLDDFQRGIDEAGVSDQNQTAASYLLSPGFRPDQPTNRDAIKAIERRGCPMSRLRDVAGEWVPPITDLEADWSGILLSSLGGEAP